MSVKLAEERQPPTCMRLLSSRTELFECVKFCVHLFSHLKTFQCLFVGVLFDGLNDDYFGLCVFLVSGVSLKLSHSICPLIFSGVQHLST